MEVFRLANASFASLDGQGGLYGTGRWHHKGNPVTHTGSSRALAVLERLIHDKESLNVPDLKMLTIHIPDEMQFTQFFEVDLPKGWDSIEITQQTQTQDLGTNFLKDNSRAFLKVPSAIVPHEFNFVLNPLHIEANRIKVVDAHNYQYDPRYKRMIRT